MSDLKGQTFLVSGANTGIGKVTARVLAGRGARVVIAGRSEEKTRAAIKEIADETGNTDLDYVALDLGDLASVRSAAETFLASGEPLHVLINNAGLAGARGMTASGFELAFGTNHIGTFLFTELLRDHIVASGPGRIVNVASTATTGPRASTGTPYGGRRSPGPGSTSTASPSSPTCSTRKSSAGGWRARA